MKGRMKPAATHIHQSILILKFLASEIRYVALAVLQAPVSGILQNRPISEHISVQNKASGK